MPLSHLYQCVPIGSLSLIQEFNRIEYIRAFHETPLNLRSLLLSSDTGSYVRGLAKTYDIPEDQAPSIAFAILEISIGKKTLAQLPAILSTELKLPNDKAQKMAGEIETDVFGPVKAELDEFLRQQKLKSNSIASKFTGTAPISSGATSPSGLRGASRGRGAYVPQNVLNLRELPAQRPQPKLSARPPQKDFPVRAPRPSLPPPLSPPRAGGEPPRFPLPPKTTHPSPYEGEGIGDEVRKPPESPIYFT